MVLVAEWLFEQSVCGIYMFLGMTSPLGLRTILWLASLGQLILACMCFSQPWEVGWWEGMYMHPGFLGIMACSTSQDWGSGIGETLSGSFLFRLVVNRSTRAPCQVLELVDDMWKPGI